MDERARRPAESDPSAGGGCDSGDFPGAAEFLTQPTDAGVESVRGRRDHKTKRGKSIGQDCETCHALERTMTTVTSLVHECFPGGTAFASAGACLNGPAGFEAFPSAALIIFGGS